MIACAYRCLSVQVVRTAGGFLSFIAWQHFSILFRFHILFCRYVVEVVFGVVSLFRDFACAVFRNEERTSYMMLEMSVAGEQSSLRGSRGGQRVDRSRDTSHDLTI